MRCSGCRLFVTLMLAELELPALSAEMSNIDTPMKGMI